MLRLSSHTSTYQIHVMFRFKPRSCCNSSSRCCYRAREHVDPARSRRIRHGGDSHPEMPSSPGSVGLARAHPQQKPRLWSLSARLGPVTVHPTRWDVGPSFYLLLRNFESIRGRTLPPPVSPTHTPPPSRKRCNWYEELNYCDRLFNRPHTGTQQRTIRSSKWQIERQLEPRFVSHAPGSLARRPMRDEKYTERGLPLFALHARFAYYWNEWY